MPKLTAGQCGGNNIAAFLDMISHSEIGDALLKVSDNGYNVLVGSTAKAPHLFTSYASHPNKLVDLGKGLKSTAAGRYQLLYRYYLPYKKLLKLTDFSPESQDRIAIQQIKEQGGYTVLQAGMFHTAIIRCANIWASLPGAGYGQHENEIASLETAYTKAGGVVAPDLRA